MAGIASEELNGSGAPLQAAAASRDLNGSGAPRHTAPPRVQAAASAGQLRQPAAAEQHSFREHMDYRHRKHQANSWRRQQRGSLQQLRTSDTAPRNGRTPVRRFSLDGAMARAGTRRFSRSLGELRAEAAQ
eukprot:2941398-Rhodomonas_salina.1